MGTLLFIGLVGGLIAGAAKTYSDMVEYTETYNELNRKRNELTASYNQAVEQTKAQAAESEEAIRANIADTKLAQGIALGTAAHNAALQDQIAQQQMAQLQLEAREQRGAAVQSVATSGVRQFGNAQVYRTQRAYDRSIAVAERQRELSRFQSMESARANYYNADRQIASYDRQITYNQNELQRTLDRYETQYNQQKAAYDENIRYMDEEGWNLHVFNNVANILSFGATGASSGMSMYRQGQGYLWD